MRLFHLFTTLCLMAGFVLLPACGTSQPTKYYLLSPSEPDTVPAGSRRELVIGVGPVSLPSYLNRREMVSRTGSNELDVAAFHQWAEPLQESLIRVVSEDLGRRLGTENVIQLPVKRSIRSALPIDYQVVIGVERFEKMPNGEAVLDARWIILGHDKSVLLLRRSEYKQMPAADTYAAQAAAQSRLLSQLGEEIAAAIEGLGEKNQP